jgi:hypothetical protein
MARMAQLEFTDEEILELKQGLETLLHDLRVELAGTDNLEFKAGLRERLDRLERISARVSSLTARLGTKETAPIGGGVDARRVERLAHPDVAQEEAEELLASDVRTNRREALESNPDTAEEEAERLLAADQYYPPRSVPAGGTPKKSR